MLVAAALGPTSEAKSELGLIRLMHQWVTYDWWRAPMMAAGFVSAVRAISITLPAPMN